MNKFFKFIPAALALVALASCSSDDDLLSSKSLDELNGQPVLKVTVNNDGITRANAYGDNATTVFGDGDKLRVYDEKLQKFDSFKFYTDADDASYFVIEDADNRYVAASDAKFALFGAEGQISYAGWNNGKNVALLKLQGAEYAEGTTADGVVTYKSALPLWGEVAQATGQKYEFTTNLNRLTGYAAITFTNGKYGKVTKVRARSLKYAEGKTKADYKPKAGYVIKSDGKVMKEDGATEYVSSESTFATATGATALSGWFDAVLDPESKGYLEKTSAPVEAVTDANIIQVIVDPTKMLDYTNIVYLPIVPGTYELLSFEYQVQGSEDWTVLGAAAGYTATRESKLTFGENFAAELETLVPEELSEILANDASISADLSYNIEKLTLNANDYHARYEVKIPNMKAKSVTLNIATLENLVENQQLFFINADDEDPYEGTVTINVTAVATENDAKANLPVINLPKASVVLAGDYTGITPVAIVAAKNVALGDGTTTTKFKDGNVVTITTAPEKFTVAKAASALSTISLPSTFNGETLIAGNVKSFNARKSTVTVTGKVNGSLTTQRTVTVEADGLAINTLNLNGSAQTLNLNKGFIKEITTSSSSEAARTATINNEETGATYIGSLRENDEKLTISLGTSKWAGEKIGASSTYANKDNIYTATMLASITGTPTSAYKLMTDIDLNGMNGKVWTPVELAGQFDGNNKTISNMTIAAEGVDGTGLFKTITIGSQNPAVKYLTLKDVNITSEAAVSNVGVLAGKVIGTSATENLDFYDINIDGATINLAGASTIIGGVIGNISGTNSKTAYFKRSQNDLKFQVKDVEITGYHTIGGIVGNAEANSDINIDQTVSITGLKINQTYNSNKNYDSNYARIGRLIGQADKAAKIVSGLTVTANEAAAYTLTRSVADGVVKYPVIEDETVVGKDIVKGQWEIGYSSATEAFTTAPKLKGKFYQAYFTTATGTASTLNGSTQEKALSLYYIAK